jgi:septum formation protein
MPQNAGAGQPGDTPASFVPRPVARRGFAVTSEDVPIRVVLASASPRRRDLLRAAGVDAEVRAADVDETPLAGELPEALVVRLASAKAAAVGASDDDAIVIAADTTVALGAAIFNKPVDDVDAARMLSALSGRAHHVHTGFCVRRGGDVVEGAVATRVTFRSLRDDDIAAYLATGEHRDKAGAYGIQGAAAVLVERVDGSITNVIGLPVAEVLAAVASLQSVSRGDRR